MTMTNFAFYFDAIFPGAWVLFLGCVVLLLTAFFKQKANHWIYGGTQLGLLIAFIMVFKQLAFPQAIVLSHGRFRFDNFSMFGCLLIIAIGAYSLFAAKKELTRRQLPLGEYFSLCLFSLLGMLVMASAYHFLTFYIAIELMSFPLYVLCAYHRSSSKGSEAALKYFVTGALASGLLLYGISLIYGVTHQLGFVDVGLALTSVSGSNLMMLLVGIVFVFAGIAFKLGLAPFHMWVPDVYEGAPSFVTLFIAGAPKIAVFILLVRLTQTAFVPLFEHWNLMFYVIALLSIFIGNLAALTQINLRRLLAYSSIAHMGFMLLGLATGSLVGISAALFYMISYVIVSVGSFAVITLLNNQNNSIETVHNLAGLSRRHPWIAFMMLLLVFSMAGIPPMVGFIAKFSILLALLEMHQIAVAVFMVLMSVVGLYYYLRVIKVMYFDEPENEPVYAPVISIGSKIMISITGLFALILGVFPGELLAFCQAVLL